jgi:hypothetical protein
MEENPYRAPAEIDTRDEHRSVVLSRLDVWALAAGAIFWPLLALLLFGASLALSEWLEA